MSHLLVLVFALVWTVVQCSCPTMCRCRNLATNLYQTDFYTVATCKEISTNYTEEFANKLREITFVNLKEISVETVPQDFLNLKRLSFKNSTIPPLTNLSIPSGITHLDLSGNHLKVWSNIENDSNIEILDLSNNQLSALRNYSFRTIIKLEVLNISFNNISVVESDTFQELNNLNCLDLTGNAITILNQEIFLPIPLLQNLNLSYNQLSTLNEMCFVTLLKLQQLDLSWNKLQTVAPGSLELPSLARLLLAGNQNLGISSEGSILVSTGRKLQTVDASHIGLQQVPPSLTPSIRTLKLVGNKIKNINCGDLDSFPLLQLLDFTSNKLKYVEEDALGRLDSLTMLFLTDNKMKEIPKSLPEKLEVLRIERNELDRIGDSDLQGLTKLKVLLLSDNKIRIIEAKAFSQLTSLVTLDLSKNPVSILQAGCLLGPISLQVLRLSEIELISPAKDVSFPLSAPENLITLDLSKSPGLTRQFLADTAMLAASKQLQELDLSNTDLEEIRSDLLHYLPQLRSLHLDGNKLNCSYLQWLASWMRKQDEEEYRKIICAGPATLWGTLLIDLQSEEIEIPKTTIIPINITSNLKTEMLSIADNKTEDTEKKLDNTIKINEINSRENLLNKNNSNIPRITSKTTYTKVLDEPSPVLKKTKKLTRIGSQSSYTSILDSSVHQNEEKVVREKSTTLFVDILPNTIRHWNGTADELSSGKELIKTNYHPGMIILFIGILAAIAVIVMFASKFSRKNPVREDPDIEVSSLPSVTELW